MSKKPKYKYALITNDWDTVTKFVNDKGYEIVTMCNKGTSLAFLLRLELEEEAKNIDDIMTGN